MKSIARIAVVGGGTMGRGIASTAALAGYEVALRDVDEEAVARALSAIAENLTRSSAGGRIDEKTARAARSRIRGAVDPASALRDADLVIEAVPERLDLKRATFAEAERLAPADAVLASNTSSLGIGSIAESVSRPERVVGMHFFNPVERMELLEVVRGARTAEETVAVARAVGERMGKTIIVVRDSPGFATSRLGLALGLEAIRMLEQGVASAADIDLAMELGYRHPMGPLRLTDLVGLDVRLAIAEHLHETLGSEVFRPPDLLRRLVAGGRLGRKTGEGFHRWE